MYKRRNLQGIRMISKLTPAIFVIVIANRVHVKLSWIHPNPISKTRRAEVEYDTSTEATSDDMTAA